MGQGKDFLLGGGFGVIRGWLGYHEGYHKFQVGPINGPFGHVSLIMYGFEFWSFRGLLLPSLKGPLLLLLEG
jgi:hypothetical protein